MNNVGQYIKSLRNERGYTQEQLGELVGVKKAAVQKWESGMTQNLKRTTIKKLAEIFDVSPVGFVGDSGNALFDQYDNIKPISMQKVPLLGSIACGQPIFDEMIDCYIEASSEIKADFGLVCKGDSMINARINDGDVVFIKQMSIVENGKIAAVEINGEVTLKRVYYYPDKNKLILNSENPKYEPFVFVNEELDDVRILGLAVAFTSIVK